MGSSTSSVTAEPTDYRIDGCQSERFPGAVKVVESAERRAPGLTWDEWVAGEYPRAPLVLSVDELSGFMNVYNVPEGKR